ncbi:MAG: hypothetical protein GKR90_00705 [Pseudomonadales bacterium]|nr:hypothetical protein [Pseudomonadales bacterium]
MILGKGKWLGSGKLLVEGTSVGESVEVDLDITDDDSGMTLEGRLGGDYDGEISIRVAPDDVGTYVIDARIASVALDGRAKLESEPHLGLLWNEGQTQSVSVALFRTNTGIACRGFWQELGKTRTWEILFKLKQNVVGQSAGGSNVVSLANRRR